jgi:hypothetical protein
MKKILLLLAAGFLGLAGQLHAQIIDGTTPYNFTTQQSVIVVTASNLLMEASSDADNNYEWVINPPMFPGEAPELEIGTFSAQWLTGGPVAFGTEIGSNGTYSYNFDTASSSFTDAYYGLEYIVSEGVDEYGWAELSYDSSTGTGAIVAAALDTNPNENISAGAVPEPSTYGLIGLATLALVMVRRKRIA